MSVAPPRDEQELLIREARARQRRRRVVATAAVAVLAAASLVAFGVTGVGGGSGSTSMPRPLTPVVDARAFAGHGRLAFVSRDRLWLLDGATGRLVRVAGAGAGASGPAFSPDGRWLAWSEGTKRFGVARSDGTGAHFLAAYGFGPRWLPHGRLLVGRAIYRIANGVPTRSGTAPRGLVSWAADGSGYAFVETRLDPGRRSPYDDVERVEISRSLNGPRKVWYETPESFTTRSGWEDPAVGAVAILPSGGILIWLDAFHSASIAADGLPVFEIRSPGARPTRLGGMIGSSVSLGRGGRFALGAGGDRIAWTTKHVQTCADGRCRELSTSAGPLSLEPAWSPSGRTLAYVTAADLGVDVNTFAPTMHRWYETRRLWIGHRPVPGSTGAASPVWSADGRSLLFVARDGLWLLPRLDARPVRVASPLFWPHAWPNYFGQVAWTSQFAWWSAK